MGEKEKDGREKEKDGRERKERGDSRNANHSQHIDPLLGSHCTVLAGTFEPV